MGEALGLTLRWVAQAVGGELRGSISEQQVGNVVIDSRVVLAGDIFVALRGERYDAHDFVAQVIEKGAVGIVVERGRLPAVEVGQSGQGNKGFAFIEVGDTTTALQDLARAVRRASGTRVIAITGSAGKTTTKEAVAELLPKRLRIAKNKGNLNNHIGLPISLLQLRERPDVAVMELGMNHAGEISTLVGIAEPETRVWTNVGDAHIGFFQSADAIADAKAEILERAEPGHLLVCNADDARIRARVAGFGGRTVTFGTSSDAMVRAVDVETLGIDGMRARVVTAAGERQLRTPLLGRGNLSNVLAAAAVALEFGSTLDEIVESAASLKPADRRGVVVRLRDGVVMLDDSYNSSPSALAKALETIAADKTHVSRKVAVVGEMLELGEHALRLHREAGKTAAAAGLRLLFAVGGPPARAVADAAIEAGMPASAVRYAEKSELGAEEIAAAILPGDLVLVKGSRGTRTDIVADRIATVFA
ncbi:MAG: UDP-N-acetylmuramoyl-tripeptide--D-alanyl-D-alanine ligase [Acidobacteria bacterium]|nr:UDP-N-acetylmuramoyl-tripeptide--D-alanyl-D-alanine ligase [Acidobacteriota bacterium]